MTDFTPTDLVEPSDAFVDDHEGAWLFYTAYLQHQPALTPADLALLISPPIQVEMNMLDFDGTNGQSIAQRFEHTDEAEAIRRAIATGQIKATNGLIDPVDADAWVRKTGRRPLPAEMLRDARKRRSSQCETPEDSPRTEHQALPDDSSKKKSSKAKSDSQAWRAIEIVFHDDYHVDIYRNGKLYDRGISFDSLGFKKEKTRSPIKAWEELLLLARGCGYRKSRHRNARDAWDSDEGAAMKKLSRKLKERFGLDSSPITFTACNPDELNEPTWVALFKVREN
jgi:hypothetical protein